MLNNQPSAALAQQTEGTAGEQQQVEQPEQPGGGTQQNTAVTVVHGYDQPQGSRHYVSPQLPDEEDDDSSFDSDKMEAVDEMEGYGPADENGDDGPQEPSNESQDERYGPIQAGGDEMGAEQMAAASSEDPEMYMVDDESIPGEQQIQADPYQDNAGQPPDQLPEVEFDGAAGDIFRYGAEEEPEEDQNPQLEYPYNNLPPEAGQPEIEHDTHEEYYSTQEGYVVGSQYINYNHEGADERDPDNYPGIDGGAPRSARAGRDQQMMYPPTGVLGGPAGGPTSAMMMGVPEVPEENETNDDPQEQVAKGLGGEEIYEGSSGSFEDEMDLADELDEAQSHPKTSGVNESRNVINETSRKSQPSSQRRMNLPEQNSARKSNLKEQAPRLSQQQRELAQPRNMGKLTAGKSYDSRSPGPSNKMSARGNSELNSQLDANDQSSPKPKGLTEGANIKNKGKTGEKSSNSFKNVNKKGVQDFPTQKKIEKFYMVYQGLDDRFWNGFVGEEDPADNIDYFEATDDPISVAKKHRPIPDSIDEMTLPFQTRKEIREYYELQETRECAIVSDLERECFKLTLKGSQMLITHQARQNYRDLTHRENTNKFMKEEEKMKAARKNQERQNVKQAKDNRKVPDPKIVKPGHIQRTSQNTQANSTKMSINNSNIVMNQSVQNMTQASGTRAASMLSPVIQPKKENIMARLGQPIRRPGKSKPMPTASVSSTNQTFVNQSMTNQTLLSPRVLPSYDRSQPSFELERKPDRSAQSKRKKADNSTDRKELKDYVQRSLDSKAKQNGEYKPVLRKSLAKVGVMEYSSHGHLKTDVGRQTQRQRSSQLDMADASGYGASARASAIAPSTSGEADMFDERTPVSIKQRAKKMLAQNKVSNFLEPCGEIQKNGKTPITVKRGQLSQKLSGQRSASNRSGSAARQAYDGNNQYLKPAFRETTFGGTPRGLLHDPYQGGQQSERVVSLRPQQVEKSVATTLQADSTLQGVETSRMFSLSPRSPKKLNKPVPDLKNVRPRFLDTQKTVDALRKDAERLKERYQKEKSLLETRSTNLMAATPAYPVQIKKERAAAATGAQMSLPEGPSRESVFGSASGGGRVKTAGGTRPATMVFERLNAEANRRLKKQQMKEQQEAKELKKHSRSYSKNKPKTPRDPHRDAVKYGQGLRDFGAAGKTSPLKTSNAGQSKGANKSQGRLPGDRGTKSPRRVVPTRASQLRDQALSQKGKADPRKAQSFVTRRGNRTALDTGRRKMKGSILLSPGATKDSKTGRETGRSVREASKMTGTTGEVPATKLQLMRKEEIIVDVQDVERQESSERVTNESLVLDHSPTQIDLTVVPRNHQENEDDAVAQQEEKPVNTQEDRQESVNQEQADGMKQEQSNPAKEPELVKKYLDQTLSSTAGAKQRPASRGKKKVTTRKK